jgi:hypothetical protein
MVFSYESIQFQDKKDGIEKLKKLILLLSQKSLNRKRTKKYIRKKTGDEVEKEYTMLHDALCRMHNDFDHGAGRIEELKDIFAVKCEDYGRGWITQAEQETDK